MNLNILIVPDGETAGFHPITTISQLTSAPPGFINSEEGNYQLSPGIEYGTISPLIDKGNPAHFDDDLDTTRNNPGKCGGPMSTCPPLPPPVYHPPNTCFLTGTQILLADGTSKSIDDIKVGDLLTSANEKGEVQKSKVVNTMQREADEYLVIKTVAGKSIRVTSEHPFWSNGQFQKIGDLNSGDPLNYISRW